MLYVRICLHKCKRVLAEDLHAKRGRFTHMHARLNSVGDETLVLGPGARLQRRQYSTVNNYESHESEEGCSPHW